MKKIDDDFSIMLINAGNDDSIASVANAGWPALGIITLGTAVKEKYPHAQITLLDGQLHSKETIDKKIKEQKPDIVGVSVLGTSYNNALSHAKAAKNTNAITVFGNDQAAILGHNMLRKREEIDYIITADVGEPALVEFIRHLQGKSTKQEVPELLYRDKGIIKSPATVQLNKKYPLDDLPIPDRTLITKKDWNRYKENYMRQYSQFHKKVKSITTMNRARGCARKKYPCTYCGIQDLTVRLSSPEYFWRDVQAGKDQIDANIFYEVFDSMSSRPAWIRKLIEHRPADLHDTQFFMFAQALEIHRNQKVLPLYKEINVFRLNMGLDSGDDVMLKRLKGPYDSVQINREVLELINTYDMKGYISFVLGGPGETAESLQNSIDFAAGALHNNLVAGVDAAPLYPEFNAPAGRWMMDPALATKKAEELGFTVQDTNYLQTMHKKWKLAENPDPEEVSQDYNRIFSVASWKEITDATRTIRQYSKQKGLAQGGYADKHIKMYD